MVRDLAVDRLLLAAGAVLLALAVVVTELRMNDPWAVGALLLVALVPAGALLAFGLADPVREGRTTPDASVMLVAGLALAAIALFRLFEVLGVDDPFDGKVAQVALLLLFTVVAGACALRSRSAACLLIAALAAGSAVLSAVQWIFTPDGPDPFRAVLLVLALAFAGAARALAGRHRDVLVDAAGISILGLAYLSGVAFFFLGAGADSPWGWEAVMLVAGLGLAAYAVTAQAPGPGVLAVAILALFAVSAFVATAPEGISENGDAFLSAGADPELVGWPLALVVLGLAAVALGLLRARAVRTT